MCIMHVFVELCSTHLHEVVDSTPKNKHTHGLNFQSIAHFVRPDLTTLPKTSVENAGWKTLFSFWDGAIWVLLGVDKSHQEKMLPGDSP